MLNDKLCAIALIDRLTKTSTVAIESQYAKSDTIFYKFRNSNIAVSKRLNHLDFSILSQEDWTYLLDTVNENYAPQEERVNEMVLVYSNLIDIWSADSSLISKIYKFIKSPLLNNSGISKLFETKNKNEKVLDMLLNNKATLCDVSRNYRN